MNGSDDTARRGETAASLLKAGALLTISGFLVYFFVLVRPLDPASAFIPYEFAVAAATLLFGYGWLRREWGYLIIGALFFSALLITGLMYFPLSLAR